jgi:uncharacterized membrane protein
MNLFDDKNVNKENVLHKDWHKKHQENMTLGQEFADTIAGGMGSWPFIVLQTVFVIIWMGLNLVGYFNHWDPYPFILLNLLFSTQAAYAAPIIMMAQNRQSERDRTHAEEDFKTNLRSRREIEQVQRALARIETKKLDKILAILSEKK